MALTVVPDVVANQTIHTLKPTDSARDAARLMTDFNISAVIVTDENGRLQGIVTERDLSRRVVAENRLGAEVALSEIMTNEPSSVAPTDSAAVAMERMRSLRIRHLPVVESDRVVGVVSIRDLRTYLSRQVVAV